MAALLPSRAGRRKGFALTALADAMFQLLVFFMLSSSLAPYSILTLASAPAGRSDLPGQPDPGAAPVAPGAVALWRVGRGTIRSGAVAVPLAEAAALAAAQAAAGIADVLVLPGRGATAQDLAAALEALTAARIARVRLARGGPLDAG
mgnify:CR=1 FL=1